MHYFILAVLVLLLVYAGLRAFLNANPKTLAQNLRKIGGVAMLVLALFFAATGRFVMAVPLGIFAITLLGRSLAGSPGGFNPFPGNASKSTGQRSRVRTRTVEMELDHDTGEMEGRVTAGRFTSRFLSSMDIGELMALWTECRSLDPQAAQLLEAYMDRRFAGWRDDATGASTGGPAGHSDGPMSRDEAYEVLGLQPGASKADIRRAHRTLMKKLHPDQGGSTYLAAKINQAKDLLLG